MAPERSGTTVFPPPFPVESDLVLVQNVSKLYRGWHGLVDFGAAQPHIGDPEELCSLPVWKPHLLTGDRKGTWSLYVTRNRRLTFRIDAAQSEICDVNLEDYH